ncbi:MAG: tripartite tricarboxylate transporter TctB family protein [Paracoccaceae bacterium]|nr:tripartite tricarboxylate transporter TctB family protein [Paracoccaceae bacterium]
MMSLLRSAEFGVTLALLLVSVVFLVDSLTLPGGEFDPLGPGAAPEMVAAVLIVLCTIVLVRAVVRIRKSGIREQRDPAGLENGTGSEQTPRALLTFVCLLFAYLLAFQYEAAHFVVITIMFVFFATIVLGGWNRRSVLLAACVSVGLSAILFVALTRLFVIRLPGAF